MSSGENNYVYLGVENVVKAQITVLILNIYCVTKPHGKQIVPNCGIGAKRKLFAYQRPNHSFVPSQIRRELITLEKFLPFQWVLSK